MQYWLFKSEANTWSWQDQLAKGEAGEEWDGIRNYQARNNMRLMALGDLGFFYHSLKEKSVVGIVEVCALSHPDSTTDDARWDCVDVKAVRSFQSPVSLETRGMAHNLRAWTNPTLNVARCQHLPVLATIAPLKHHG